MSLTSVSLATLVTIGSTPVIVQAAELATRRRRLGWAAVGATCLALAGLALLVGIPSGGLREKAVLAGSGMALLAAGGFAAVTLTGSRPVPGMDDLSVTGFGFTVGGLILMALAASLGRIVFTPSTAAIGLMVALGIGPTAVAYTLYFRGLRAAPASTGALLSLLEPLTGTILSALVLGDRLGGSGIAGSVMLAAAVLLTIRANRQR